MNIRVTDSTMPIYSMTRNGVTDHQANRHPDSEKHLVLHEMRQSVKIADVY